MDDERILEWNTALSSTVFAEGEHSGKRGSLGSHGFTEGRYDRTMNIFAHTNDMFYSDKILSLRIGANTRLLVVFCPRLELLQEPGVTFRILFDRSFCIDDQTVESIYSADTLSTAFEDGVISVEEVHMSISASDGNSARKWREIALSQETCAGLKTAILSHPIYS